MAQLKPAKTYLAKALPHPSGSGYAAQFAFPGVVPCYVLAGDSPARYDSADAAEVAALRVMRDSLNSRDRWTSKRDHHNRMTGPEFAAELAATGLYPGEFALLWGTTQARVMDWIDGTREIPFAMRWILPLLRLPGAVAIAREVTRHHTTPREERHPIRV